MKVITGQADGRYFHIMESTRAGEVCPTHAHTYAHSSLCAAGLARVRTPDGAMDEMRPFSIKSIPAGIPHEFEFVEAGTIIICIHDLVGQDGERYPFDYTLTGQELMAATARL